MTHAPATHFCLSSSCSLVRSFVFSLESEEGKGEREKRPLSLFCLGLGGWGFILFIELQYAMQIMAFLWGFIRAFWPLCPLSLHCIAIGVSD